MQRFDAMRAGSLVVLLTVGGCTGFVGEYGILEGFDGRFAEVKKGQTRQEVLEDVVAPPAREVPTLELPQREGYEHLYDEADSSGAVTYLYWDSGVDEVAVVGLNADGEVVFKCRAGT
jgi:hypothetical protein